VSAHRIGSAITIAALLTTLVFAMRLAVQAITLIAIAKTLGPVLYGAFSATSALALTLGSLSTFGTHLLLLAATSRQPDVLASEARTAPPVTLVSGLLLLIAYHLIAFAWFKAGVIGVVPIIAIGLTEIIVQPLIQLVSVQKQGRGEIARSQLLLVAPLVFRAGSAVFVTCFQVADPLLVYSCLSLAGTALILFLAILRDAAWVVRSSQWQTPTFKELRRAFEFAILNLVALAPAELDKVVAYKLLQSDAAGLYAAASRVLGAAVTPVVALMVSVAPKLFNLDSLRQISSRHFVFCLFAVAGTYGVSIGAVIWAASGHVSGLFGPSYISLGATINALVFITPLLALRIVVGNVLMTLGFPLLRVSTELLGIVIFLVSTGLLIPPMGLIGMVIASALSETFVFVMGALWIFTRREDLQNPLSLEK